MSRRSVLWTQRFVRSWLGRDGISLPRVNCGPIWTEACNWQNWPFIEGWTATNDHQNLDRSSESIGTSSVATERLTANILPLW
jgi:hypothetical protein